MDTFLHILSGVGALAVVAGAVWLYHEGRAYWDAWKSFFLRK